MLSCGTEELKLAMQVDVRELDLHRIIEYILSSPQRTIGYRSSFHLGLFEF